MFGYVRPFKPEMKISEFDTYKAIYCGLCRQIKKDYGNLPRMTLSYDFAFLTLLGEGLGQDPVQFERGACVSHPFVKKPFLCSCETLAYTAGCAMLMLRYKWKDNLADSKWYKRPFLWIGGLPFLRAGKKASKRYPEMAEKMKATLGRQQDAEKSPTCTLDSAASASSEVLGYLFECLSSDEKERQVLNRFGFLLGRFIYLIDAVDDLKKDRETGNYNPFLRWADSMGKKANVDEEIRKYAEGLINITHGEMTLAYELLNMQRYQSIIENILYLGLPSVKKQVIFRLEEAEQ